MVVILKHKQRGDTITVTQKEGYVSVDMTTSYNQLPVIIKYLNFEETLRALHGNGYDVVDANNNEGKSYEATA